MTQRIRSQRAAYNHHPFDGEGVSLYGSIGETVTYRNLRLLSLRRRRGGYVKGTAGKHDISGGVKKTARLTSTSSPAMSIGPFAIPAAFASQTIAWDVRRFKDDVENQSDNFRTVRTELDGSRDHVQEILGTATLLSVEVLAGGVCVIRFIYHPALEGVQPTVMRAIRTAGPTSPANADASYFGQRIVEVTTPALSDASPYTYKIQARNTAGTVTLDILTGIAVQADATGPATPTSGSADAR